jgi:hypothetical protein
MSEWKAKTLLRLHHLLKKSIEPDDIPLPHGYFNDYVKLLLKLDELHEPILKLSKVPS